MSEKLYLKVGEYNGYDDFYFQLNSKDKTWNSVLEKIESVLDDKYLDNGSKLEGIKVSVEIVTVMPDEVEMI